MSEEKLFFLKKLTDIKYNKEEKSKNREPDVNATLEKHHYIELDTYENEKWVHDNAHEYKV